VGNPTQKSNRLIITRRRMASIPIKSFQAAT
jgi:hypothetical protein